VRGLRPARCARTSRTATAGGEEVSHPPPPGRTSAAAGGAGPWHRRICSRDASGWNLTRSFDALSGLLDACSSWGNDRRVRCWIRAADIAVNQRVDKPERHSPHIASVPKWAVAPHL
jgi:hypothetical protein